MSKWGSFVDHDGERHIAPVDAEGFMLPPHVLEPICECEPILETQATPHLWVHNDPARGGTNA